MKHKVVKKSEIYKIKDGKAEKGRKFCPKCGPGVFMADHGNRIHCGRCGYAEFNIKKDKKEEGKKEDKSKKSHTSDSKGQKKVSKEEKKGKGDKKT